MENNMLEEAIVSIQDFICRVADKNDPKTEMETAVLPKTIGAFIDLLRYKEEKDRKK